MGKQDSVQPGIRSAFHPYLFAVYPILFIFSRNMDEVSYKAIVLPAAISLLGTLIVLFILRLLFTRKNKAHVLTSIGLLMFYLYGPLFDRFFRGLTVRGCIIGRNAVFFTLWSLLGVFLSILVIKIKRGLLGFNNLFNITSVLLISICLVSIMSYELKGDVERSYWTSTVSRLSENMNAVGEETQTPLRDIYYIILDEYARKDVLKKYYGYDNIDFINFLEEKGFYVASQSTCNYLATCLSLSSSLNMNYIQALLPEMDAGSGKNQLYIRMIRDNTVIRILRKYGYRYIVFPSMWKVTSENPFADKVLVPSRINLSEFEETLVNSSILRVIAAHRFTSNKRLRTIFTLDKLCDIPYIKEPTFTFAHVIIPHPPFLFDAEGNKPCSSLMHKRTMSQNEYVKGYVDQVEFLNKKLKTTIDKIISLSDVPPIIIIQGDTGPGFMMPESMKDSLVSHGEPCIKHFIPSIKLPIFNAYYLPDGGDTLLYKSMSPVNTFRFVFNHYFSTHLKPLRDQSYDIDVLDDKVYFVLVSTP